MKIALDHVVSKVEREGRRQYSNESRLQLLKQTFQKAIKSSNELLKEVERALAQIRQCDTILRELDINGSIIRDFEYRELNNWLVFREYANQLEFNKAAFGILMNRIKEANGVNGHKRTIGFEP